MAGPGPTPLFILLPLELMPEGAHVLAHRAAGTCSGGKQRAIKEGTYSPTVQLAPAVIGAEEAWRGYWLYWQY